MTRMVKFVGDNLLNPLERSRYSFCVSAAEIRHEKDKIYDLCDERRGPQTKKVPPISLNTTCWQEARVFKPIGLVSRRFLNTRDLLPIWNTVTAKRATSTTLNNDRSSRAHVVYHLVSLGSLWETQTLTPQSLCHGSEGVFTCRLVGGYLSSLSRWVSLIGARSCGHGRHEK